ncbi:MAG: HTH domain-containing protein [Candidatus Diapherotrites archaeon]
MGRHTSNIRTKRMRKATKPSNPLSLEKYYRKTMKTQLRGKAIKELFKKAVKGDENAMNQLAANAGVFISTISYSERFRYRTNELKKEEGIEGLEDLWQDTLLHFIKQIKKKSELAETLSPYTVIGNNYEVKLNQRLFKIRIEKAKRQKIKMKTVKTPEELAIKKEAFEKTLKKGKELLTSKQFEILKIIIEKKGDITQTELAKKFNVTRQRIKQQLQTIQKIMGISLKTVLPGYNSPKNEMN